MRTIRFLNLIIDHSLKQIAPSDRNKKEQGRYKNQDPLFQIQDSNPQVSKNRAGIIVIP